MQAAQQLTHRSQLVDNRNGMNGQSFCGSSGRASSFIEPTAEVVVNLAIYPA